MWAETAADGTFKLKGRIAFLSVRHRRYKPFLSALDEAQKHVEIELASIDKSVWRLPRCRNVSDERSPLIGGGLKVRLPGNRYRGPVSGDHDTHWFIDFSEDYSLHIVSGPNWHSGLPLGSWLDESTRFEHRGWVSGDLQGLDVSGETSNGKKWRWVGAMVSDAVSYHDVPAEAAGFFDAVIDTACFGQAK